MSCRSVGEGLARCGAVSQPNVSLQPFEPRRQGLIVLHALQIVKGLGARKIKMPQRLLGRQVYPATVTDVPFATVARSCVGRAGACGRRALGQREDCYLNGARILHDDNRKTTVSFGRCIHAPIGSPRLFKFGGVAGIEPVISRAVRPIALA